MHQEPRIPAEYRFFHPMSWLIGNTGVYAPFALTKNFLPNSDLEVATLLSIFIAIAAIGTLSLVSKKIAGENLHFTSLLTGAVSGGLGLAVQSLPDQSDTSLRILGLVGGEVAGSIGVTALRIWISLLRTR